MAAMIEGQARAEAKVRQVAGLMKGGVNPRSGQLGVTGNQAEFTRESRQQIAEAVGMATTTLRTGCDTPHPGHALGFLLLECPDYLHNATPALPLASDRQAKPPQVWLSIVLHVIHDQRGVTSLCWG